MSTVCHRVAGLLCFVIGAAAPGIHAQPVRSAGVTDTATRASILGDVIDATTGRPVALAQVRIRGTAMGSITDLGGRFAIRLVPTGSYTLDIRRIGFEPLVRNVVLAAGATATSLSITLVPSAFRLSEVTVAPGAFAFLDGAPVSRTTLSRTAIQDAPFGEDLFRAMNRLPGLSSGDYGAHFSIRGGRQDETLFLLDGLELYEPFHLKDFNEGALSIIDVDAVDGVELLTGGFSAHYGDKRSGVMNISTRTPTKDGTRASVGASLTSAHALFEGTFAGSNGSWLVSGRRGFIDALLRILNKKETKAPSYQDAFGTLRYRVRPNHALALNALYASDRYRFTIRGTTGFADSIPTEERANNGYGNSYVWMTLRSLFGQHLTVRSLASTGVVNASRAGDEHHVVAPLEYYGVDGRRDFTVRGLKQDFSYQRAARAIVDWGYDARWMHANYNWVNRVTQNPDNPQVDTTGFYPRITRRAKQTGGSTLGAYISNRLQLAEPLTLELGVRYDAATYSHDRDWSPRVHALYKVAERTSLRAGWGAYRQRQGIADENAFDKLNRYFPSELSRQWTLGLQHQYAHGGSLRVEAYDKTGSRLRPILRNWKAGLNVFPESAEDRILVYPDATTSRGLELYHERSIGPRVNLRVGYAFSRVEERVSKIDNVNDRLKLSFNPTHAAPQDQRHALNVDASYRFRTHWTINGAVTTHSGWPFTNEIGVPVTRRNGTKDLAVLPDTLYESRLPFYQRMDMRLTRRRQTANGEFRFFVEVINLTNHENVLGYDVFRIRDAAGTLQLVRSVESWFSILPSVGVSWSRKF